MRSITSTGDCEWTERCRPLPALLLLDVDNVGPVEFIPAGSGTARKHDGLENEDRGRRYVGGPVLRPSHDIRSKRTTKVKDGADA